MPRLSDSMEEGTILKWLKAAGEDVSRGEALVEIETDKATMTYESDATGRLEIVAAEGDTLPIGAVIARLGGEADGSDRGGASAGGGGDAGGAPAGVLRDPAAGVQGAPPAVAAPDSVADGVIDLPVDAPADRAGDLDGDPVEGPADLPAGPPGAWPPGADVEPSGGGDSDGRGERVRASPLARRIAREQGVDLGSVRGTGPGGRVVRADVERDGAGAPGGGDGVAPAVAAASPTGQPPSPGRVAPPAAPVAPAAASIAPVAASVVSVSQGAPAGGDQPTGKGTVTTEEPTRAQQVVARRMASSKATVPEFTLNAEIAMGRCVELRSRLKGLGGGRLVPSYNDIVVKACGLALREHPRANGAWRDGRFELFSRVNVGVAVAGEGVLVVPTVFDADVKALEEIAAETRRLAGRVRDATITPPELSGATFTVSNLGMFGVKSFTAVINPPQAAILAVGAVTQRAVVVDGELAVGQAMDVTLACDHRILYGADAARLLGRIRELIEEPLALLR
jgi:pyruvate dehydrogenase E2 component (dihydrolipoamide acetyltransferase)